MMRHLVTVVAVAALPLAGCAQSDPGDDSAQARHGSPSSPSDDAPRRPPSRVTFTGTITAIEPHKPITQDCKDVDEPSIPPGPVSSEDEPLCTDPTTAPLGTVLVETTPQDSHGDAVVFTVIRDTDLWSSYTGTGDEDLTQIPFDALDPGATVDVGFSGLVAESYPGQATAESITLVDPGS